MTFIPSQPVPTILNNSLVGNFNSNAIIQAELTPYRQQVMDIQNQQSTLNSNVQDYQTINSDLVALQTAAEALNTSTGWNARQATSSDSAVATATATAGTPVGSVQFVVQQLAAADSLVSSGSVASTSTIVDSNSSYLLSQGGAQIGFNTLVAGSSLPLGAHTVTVTQASQAASTTGTAVLGTQSSGITITSGSNDTLAVSVNGTAYNLTIAAGSYSGSGLLSAVNSAISSAGASGVLAAGYDAAGHLILSTIDQGSTQNLQVTGGTALSTLGLSTMASPTTGVDGIVSVDGTTTTLTTVTPGSTATLNSSTGSITATLVGSSSQSQVNSSLLSTGSVTATNVSTGSGSLSDLVTNINAAGTGITASAIKTGSGQYVLQLTSSTTGSASDLSVDTGAFSASGLGTMQTATAGADAQIQIGGSGGYTLTSQTDTFTGLLPGLSITAVSQSSSPVTVSVSPDASTMSTQVGNLVSAANTVLSDIQKYAGYNAATKTGGPLMGSAQLQTVTNEVQSIFASVEGTSTLGNAKNVGITLSNGTISFDSNAFQSAFNANPTAVADMFTQGGSFSASSPSYTGSVSLSYAGNATKAGSYAVVVSQSASQAVDTGATVSGGTISTPETLTVAMGSASVNYATTNGQTLAQVAAGLNSAMAGAGIDLTAEVVNSGTQLQLVSAGYGSATSFSVSSTNTAAGSTGLAGATANTPVTFAGTDVVGTINGVAATGQGQYLTAPTSDPTLAGLSLQVGASGISSSTNLGTFTYNPGIAQQLASFSSSMSDPVSGSITAVVTGLQNQSQGLTTQISFYTNIESQEQQILLKQFANLQQTLATLQNTSSSLTSALAGLG